MIPAEAPGLAVRRIAAGILEAVLHRRQPLDEQLERSTLLAIDERDRALTRRLVATTLRRLGTLRHLLTALAPKGMPADAPRVETALLVGATQIVFLDVPDHAAVDLSVRLVRSDRRTERFAGFVNAVLRRLAVEGRDRLATIDSTALDTPPWLMERWRDHYGKTAARSIAEVHAIEPALDLTIKQSPDISPDEWATRLGGRVLPTGTVRLVAHGPVTQLQGYAEGAWWVQDAAAALPARLLGDVRGRTVADLCAAPGGKTAQLAAAGALVTAVDRAPARLARLRDNLSRLGLHAKTVTADALTLSDGPFDAVLVDAPCSATGTIRRHPDIPWLKSASDLDGLVAHQTRLLDHAASLVRPDGMLVYCTCSLEPEEGERLAADWLTRNPTWRRVPIQPAEVGGLGEAINAEGDLRTLPCHLSDPDPRLAGLDGFYAIRLVR